MMMLGRGMARLLDVDVPSDEDAAVFGVWWCHVWIELSGILGEVGTLLNLTLGILLLLIWNFLFDIYICFVVCLSSLQRVTYYCRHPYRTVHGDDARVGIYSQPLRCKSYILLVPVYTCAFLASWWHFLHYVYAYRGGAVYIHGSYASILVAWPRKLKELANEHCGRVMQPN